ncbi:hypothetical protein Tco_0744933 [Tanacetum coccineum]
MIQVKEMMQDNDLKNSKSKDKGSRSRSQSMDEQSHYKQDKTKTRQSINVKSHIFNCALPTEGMRSIISTVSISLEGFLPSILLLVMIIVVVILVVMVVALVGVVIVVMIIGVLVIITIIRVVVVVVGGVSFILKLSFMIIGFLHRIAL